jgi:hypothetical protein
VSEGITPHLSQLKYPEAWHGKVPRNFSLLGAFIANHLENSVFHALGPSFLTVKV